MSLTLFSCGTTPAPQPSKTLQAFAKEMRKKGMVSDHNRLEEKGLYGELNVMNTTVIDGSYFYEIVPQRSKLWSTTQTTNNQFLVKAKAVVGFFYRDGSQSEMITDGVVEEWQFATAQEAQQAFTVVQPQLTECYFNTNPYAFVTENRMYVFHTRAMVFSFPQKNDVELFKSLK